MSALLSRCRWCGHEMPPADLDYCNAIDGGVCADAGPCTRRRNAAQLAEMRNAVAALVEGNAR